MVQPYTFDDVVAAMASVQPYDWRSFFHDHLNSVDPHLAMGGVTRAGWKLVFNDQENWALKDDLSDPKQMNLRASLGITLDDKGEVGDVVAGRPAALAGIAPGFTIVAIDGRAFSNERINAAVKASKDSSKPLDVIAKNGDDFGTYHIDYHGGARYPHLVRTESTRDLLTDILSKRTR
jgi:predicted metalloprotease with PDZ domain